jgi:hypothetical protein
LTHCWTSAEVQVVTLSSRPDAQAAIPESGPASATIAPPSEDFVELLELEALLPERLELAALAVPPELLLASVLVALDDEALLAPVPVVWVPPVSFAPPPPVSVDEADELGTTALTFEALPLR